MQTEALKQEKKYLKISALGNILVGCIVIAVAAVSSSQAIMLDGMFNVTYFATGLFTIKVASLVAGGDDERFPHGYAFFEPLVNGIKGMLVLGVSVMALIGSVQERFIRVIQPGRQRLVLVHVVLPGYYEPGPMTSLDTIRRQTYQALRKDHVVTAVDIVFTADRRWGAPLSDGGFGGPAPSAA